MSTPSSWRALAAVLALAPFLYACGGSNTATMKLPPYEPSPTNDEVKQAILELANRADYFRFSDRIVRIPGERRPQRVESVCDGIGCTIDGRDIYLSDVTFRTDGFVREGTHAGFALFDFHRDFGEQEWRYYGGWGKYVFFDVTWGHGLFDGKETTRFYGTLMGDATGSVPVAGPAIWTGSMAAVRVGSSRPRLRGNARLTMDFSAQTVDVAFTNVRAVDAQVDEIGLRWDDIPLTADGFAAHRSPTNQIEGAFFGPEHEEAGGLFERGSIVGGFGVARETE